MPQRSLAELLAPPTSYTNETLVADDPMPTHEPSQVSLRDEIVDAAKRASRGNFDGFDATALRERVDAEFEADPNFWEGLHEFVDAIERERGAS
jgi:hypothetical protein